MTKKGCIDKQNFLRPWMELFMFWFQVTYFFQYKLQGRVWSILVRELYSCALSSTQVFVHRFSKKWESTASLSDRHGNVPPKIIQVFHLCERIRCNFWQTKVFWTSNLNGWHICCKELPCWWSNQKKSFAPIARRRKNSLRGPPWSTAPSPINLTWIEKSRSIYFNNNTPLLLALACLVGSNLLFLASFMESLTIWLRLTSSTSGFSILTLMAKIFMASVSEVMLLLYGRSYDNAHI